MTDCEAGINASSNTKFRFRIHFCFILGNISATYSQTVKPGNNVANKFPGISAWYGGQL